MTFKPYQLALISLVLAGCQTAGSDSAVQQASTALSISQTQNWQNQLQTQAFVSDGWLTNLNDERLQSYIDTALANNPDLRASAAQLEASIANSKIAASRLWPSLDARLTHNRSQSESVETSGIQYATVYSGSLNIAWELDIWGRLNAQSKAAVLDAASDEANYAAARLALVANVARGWFNINATKLRLELAEQRLESQQQTLAVIEENYKSGLRSALDVYLNRTDVASQQSSILELKDLLEQSTRNFRQLLGSYPDIDLDFTARLPELESTVPAGLPSELLLRRPDVLASQRLWESSKLNAKAANRARFPSFSLTASYGASSNKLRLLDEQNLLWSLVNNLTAPLFNGGQLKAQAEQAEFLADASFQSYLSTLLTSFTEVENALSAEQYLKQRAAAIEQAAFYAESGYALAFDQYKSGLIDYTTLLETQRRWFDTQSSLIVLKNNLLQNRIALNLALGGDFVTASSAE